MRLTRLFEGLDDKDEFENCDICPNNEGYLVAPQYQPEEFHFDHIDAHNAGNKARDAATPDDSYDAWIEASRRVMMSRGYKRITSIHGQDYWFKIPIKEDLDDQDEFTRNCDACIRNERESGRTLPPDFHIAHTQAEGAVDRVLAYTLEWTSGADIARRAHDAEFNTMHKYGYTVKGVNYDGYKIWVKPSLKEDLDDQDRFGPECGYCTEYANEVADQQRFHEKHEQAEIAAERAAWEATGGWNSSAGRQKYSDIFNARLREAGYVRRDARGPWIDKPLKEDLDDQDQFGKIKVLHRYTDKVGVVYTLEDGSTYLYPYNARYSVHLIDPTGNVTRIDHIDDMPEIDRLMANPPSSPFGPEQKQLWRRVVGEPITESLDDQDEFLVPNVHHYQLEDSTEDNEHWQIDMRNEADDQRLQGEYWVRGGMGKGMYLKANFSQLDDNTAQRVLTDASGSGVGDYHVDWDQAVADAQRTGY